MADAQGLDPTLTGVASATFAPAALGFVAPSLFVAARTAHPADAPAGTTPNVIALTTPDSEVSVTAWLDAASTVTPFVQRWLGPRPRTPLTLLDLPDPDDAPWESGPLLVTSLKEGPADRLQRAARPRPRPRLRARPRPRGSARARRLFSNRSGLKNSRAATAPSACLRPTAPP